jgi:hypothetical protein
MRPDCCRTFQRERCDRPSVQFWVRRVGRLVDRRGFCPEHEAGGSPGWEGPFDEGGMTAWEVHEP